MGTNFHVAWIAGTSKFDVASMNVPLSTLDRGITFIKNVMIGCDGNITYNSTTGVLTWTGTINIFFNNTAGVATKNTIAAGSLTLADGELAYVTLSEINNAALTASKAAITTGAASNYLAYNILALGYRNTSDDNFYGALWPIISRTAFIGTTFFDANTIACATADNTPYAMPIGTNTIFGRAAGNIAALTPAQVRDDVLDLDSYFLTIDVNPIPGSDHTTNGRVSNFMAGKALNFGDACQINGSGNLILAKADQIDNAWALFLATATVASGATADFLLPGGYARDDTWNWTVGKPIFLSTTGTTGNTLTQTAPSGSNEVIQIVGIATHADRMFFYPQLVQVEHT